MAITVTISETAGPATINLDLRQTELFMRELRRVTGFLSFSWIRWLLSLFVQPRGLSPLIQPDCKVTVDRNGRTMEYELLGSYVLRRKGSRIQHQFYFGLLLLEWLYR